MYLQNEGVSRHETLQLVLFLFPLQHMKRPALQNKQVVVFKWLFGPAKFSGLLRNRAQGTYIWEMLVSRVARNEMHV